MIREVLVIATVGIALALPVAWWLSRYVESELCGVKPTDAVTVAGSVISSWALPRSRALFHRRAPPSQPDDGNDTSNAECRVLMPAGPR